MMPPPDQPEAIATAGSIRLLADTAPRWVILEADGRKLMRLALTPHWLNSDPLGAARMALNILRPQPPRLDMDASAGDVTGGTYHANADTVLIYGRQSMSEHHLAALLLHEAAHATGHASRLARAPFNGVVPSSAPLPPEHAAERFKRRDEPDAAPTDAEELIASLAASFVAVALGIFPAGSQHHHRWIARAARLPLTDLEQALRDAIAAASWMLGGNPPPAELIQAPSW